MAWAEIEGEVVNNEFHFDQPVAPFTVVRDRFDQTLTMANEMLDLLVGEDGTSGYLGDLNTVIQDAPVTSVDIPVIDTNYTLESSGLSVPQFDSSDLAIYPTANYPDPVINVLPEVDTNFIPVQEPEDIDPSLNYNEVDPSTVIYNPLLAKMLVFLQDGYTGIDTDAEQALYDRARTRQQVVRVAEYNKINDTVLGMQFAMPSGVLLSALTDFSIGATRQDAEINNQIIITQSELEQKNNQFILQQATALEQLIRQMADSASNRALEAAKAEVNAIMQDFSERVKRYVAIWEGRRTAVMAQIEVLKGVIEANRSAVDVYKAQYDAFKVQVDAVSAQNKNLVDVFAGEVQGFSEAERAIAARNESAVRLITANVAAAEVQVRAAIADAENLIAGYSAEGGLRQQVTVAMANITGQAVASMMSAVNASASWGYSAGESTSASFNMGVSLNESHQFEHDPTV